MVGKISEMQAAVLPLRDTDLFEVSEDQGDGSFVSKRVPRSELVAGGGSWGSAVFPGNQGTAPLRFADEFDDSIVDPGWFKAGTAATATVREGNDALSFRLTSGVAGAASKPLGVIRAQDLTPPFTLDTAVQVHGQYARNYLMFGLLLTTSGTNGTGNALWYMPYTNSSNAGGASVSVRYGANWTMATDYGSVQYAGDWSGWLHQRIVAKGSDQWQFFVSHDGVSWLDLWGGVKTIAGFAPTHMGIGYSTWGATWTGTASAEFIRLYDSDLGDSPAGYFDVL